MFTDFAQELGLDTVRFQTDLDDPQILARIKDLIETEKAYDKLRDQEPPY